MSSRWDAGKDTFFVNELHRIKYAGIRVFTDSDHRFCPYRENILPWYLVPPAAVQQRATIWFYFNLPWAILGAWYKFVLPLRRVAVARQVFFRLPLVSLHHVRSNSLQPLLVDFQVGGGYDQLTECVFLPPFQVDFWIMHDLVLHHFLF